MDRSREPLRVARKIVRIKKEGSLSGAQFHYRVRQELLIPIDGTTEVQADAELEEVEHAVEQKARIARGDGFLSEDRHAACLDLYTTDANHRAPAALPLDFVEERV